MILAQTARSFGEETDILLKAGCDDFLSKPYRDSEVFDMLRKHLGMEFVYEDGARKQAKLHLLKPEALAGLSGEWMAELEESAGRADFITLNSMIEKIGESGNTMLADALKRFVDDFDYDGILAVIRRMGEGE